MARDTGGSSMPLTGLRAISRYILLAGGFLIVLACALIVIEIVMRQVFSSSMGGVGRLSSLPRL